VQATVREIGPSDGEEADWDAEQINKAFRRWKPTRCRQTMKLLVGHLSAGLAKRPGRVGGLNWHLDTGNRTGNRHPSLA
jgi:hypothetical protein